MDQYYHIKKNYPDILLLFRMGDFYELFFDDAVKAAKILGITLTHRGKVCGTPIPMAGIPHHAASNYVDRLTAYGLKAAICEQVEDSKDAVGIVQRKVVRIASPGMPYDLDKADGREYHFIASACFVNNTYFLAVCDFTTGKFVGHRLADAVSLLNRLAIYHPKELLSFKNQWKEHKIVDNFLKTSKILKTLLAPEYFKSSFCSVPMEKLIPGVFFDKALGRYPGILDAAGALCYYICSTQRTEQIIHMEPFCLEDETGHMMATLNTLQGLEIIPASKEKYKESLLFFFDKTKTSMGARSLRSVFLSPLTCQKELRRRHDFIEYLLSDISRLEDLCKDLQNIYDFERILAKISTKHANGQDLIALARSINVAMAIGEKLDVPKELLEGPGEREKESLKILSSSIEEIINDEPGADASKGNLIREGVSQERDYLVDLSKNAMGKLEELQKKYREQTNISKLKFKFNNVLGSFIEVSKSHAKKVPSSFTRKQTLVGSERYTTDELIKFDKELIHSKEKLEHIEQQIFQQTIKKIAENSQAVMKLSRFVGYLDVWQSLAKVAYTENLVRPRITEEKLLHVEDGYHPLIKSHLKDQFVTHNFHLDKECFFALITGPNMAGKTTIMREAALIQFLAQIGSFVPAVSAELGICNHLFSRLGASDDIIKGQSTFMMEMTEVAEILRHANDRSLIILDEVGRGTSTYDGMSIAWALVEHLVLKTKALAFFATHYHELTNLADKLAGAGNFTVETVVEGEEVRFLYSFVRGGAAQSHGIYVAKLAGLPYSVLKRSREILQTLEGEKEDRPKQVSRVQESFFESPKIPFELLHEAMEKLQCFQTEMKNTFPDKGNSHTESCGETLLS